MASMNSRREILKAAFAALEASNAAADTGMPTTATEEAFRPLIARWRNLRPRHAVAKAAYEAVPDDAPSDRDSGIRSRTFSRLDSEYLEIRRTLLQLAIKHSAIEPAAITIDGVQISAVLDNGVTDLPIVSIVDLDRIRTMS